MKFDFMYGTPCVVTVIDTYDNSWEFGTVFHKVQDAFNVAEDIFNGYTVWNPSTVDVIYITDTETGEILVECTHDDDNTEEVYKTDNEDFIAYDTLDNSLPF